MKILKSFLAIATLISATSSFGHKGWPPEEGRSEGEIYLEELELEDDALRECILQWADVEFNLYSQVKDVREISCADKGIKSLKGIEVFSEYMIALDLSGNEITDWSPLFDFHHVGAIYLFDTEISCYDLIPLRKSLHRAMFVGVSLQTCTYDEE